MIGGDQKLVQWEKVEKIHGYTIRYTDLGWNVTGHGLYQGHGYTGFKLADQRQEVYEVISKHAGRDIRPKPISGDLFG